MTERITDAKILLPDALAERLDREREHGHKIVVTNGVFDLMHVGHLRYLQAAAEEGDRLLILLNDDASVRAIKGPSRPIVPQEERAEMLAGLACVDYVSLFSGSSPAARLAQVKPDIYVKGGDYTLENLPERAVLEDAGSRIAFIPFVQGRSTTNIIGRILDLAK